MYLVAYSLPLTFEIALNDWQEGGQGWDESILHGQGQDVPCGRLIKVAMTMLRAQTPTGMEETGMTPRECLGAYIARP